MVTVAERAGDAKCLTLSDFISFPSVFKGHTVLDFRFIRIREHRVDKGALIATVETMYESIEQICSMRGKLAENYVTKTLPKFCFEARDAAEAVCAKIQSESRKMEEILERKGPGRKGSRSLSYDAARGALAAIKAIEPPVDAAGVAEVYDRLNVALRDVSEVLVRFKRDSAFYEDALQRAEDCIARNREAGDARRVMDSLIACLGVAPGEAPGRHGSDTGTKCATGAVRDFIASCR